MKLANGVYLTRAGMRRGCENPEILSMERVRAIGSVLIRLSLLIAFGAALYLPISQFYVAGNGSVSIWHPSFFDGCAVRRVTFSLVPSSIFNESPARESYQSNLNLMPEGTVKYSENPCLEIKHLNTARRSKPLYGTWSGESSRSFDSSNSLVSSKVGFHPTAKDYRSSRTVTVNCVMDMPPSVNLWPARAFDVSKGKLQGEFEVLQVNCDLGSFFGDYEVQSSTGRVSAFPRFPRLPCNDKHGPKANKYEKHLSGFKNCVPGWRVASSVICGICGIVGGIVFACRTNDFGKFCYGFAVFVAGFVVYVTGYQPCENTDQRDNDTSCGLPDAIRARLAIPDPRYDWYQRGPLPIEEQQFNKIGDNVTCIIDANDDLTISTPNGWTTCLRAISCAMPTGEVCTRIPR